MEGSALRGIPGEQFARGKVTTAFALVAWMAVLLCNVPKSVRAASGGAVNNQNPISSLWPSQLPIDCNGGLLEALKLGTDLTALVRFAPKTANTATPAESDLSPQPWVQQLVALIEPLRAGGALVELLQSSFFHEGLAEQALEQGWVMSERFYTFFNRIAPAKRVDLLRALTVRLWLYTFRDPQHLRATTSGEDLLRYRELLMTFMASGTDEVVHQFLARIQFEQHETAAEIHRVMQIDDPYEREPAFLYSKNCGIQAFEATGRAILSTAPTPKVAFAYWMAVNRQGCSEGVKNAALQTWRKEGLLGEQDFSAQLAMRLPDVDASYLSTLETNVLTLRVHALRWRLAMSRITNPAGVVDDLRRHVEETLHASAQGTTTASGLLASLGNFVLNFVGRSVFGVGLATQDIAFFGDAAASMLPANVREAANSLFATLDTLKLQLDGWVRQASSMGNPEALLVELAQLERRLAVGSVNPPSGNP